MKTLLTLLALLWTLPALAQPVNPQTVTPVSIHGSAPVRGGPCSTYTGNAGDGCLVSPGGTIQHANFFTSYALQSGQTYTTRPNWNVACVDYACGAYTAQGSMADPTTLNSGPCQYNATGSAQGGAAVVCASSSSPVTIGEIDFSLHNCTQLIIKTSYTGTLTVQDNYWKNGSNCNGTTGAGTFINGQNFGSYSCVIESNTFDGDEANFATGAGAAGCSTSGTTIFEYNAFLRIPGRPLGESTNNNIIVQWNYFEGYVYLPYQGHGEINVFSIHTTAPSLVNISFNTILEPSTVCNCSTTTIYTSSGQGNTWNNWTVDNNVEVVNLAGGGTAAVSGTGTVDNGAGAPGNVFTATTVSAGTLGVGQSITIGVDTLWITANLSGSGPGSTWSVVCTGSITAPSSPCSGSVNPSVQLSGAYTGAGNPVGPAGSETAHDTFNQIAFANNYIDKTGGNSFFQALSGSHCTNATTFSGNVDLVTGVSENSYSLNQSTGC